MFTYTAIITATVALFAGTASADFQIYTSSSITGTPDGEYHSGVRPSNLSSLIYHN